MENSLRRKTFSLLAALYPLLVFFAIKNGSSPKLLSLIFLGVMCLSAYINRENKLFSVVVFFVGLVLVTFSFLLNNRIFVFFYPALMNFSFFLLFSLSLRNEKTLIEVFAQKMKYDTSSADAKKYMRKTTIAWSVFLFLNTLVSIATVFCGENIWTLYNGLISYILMGIFFVCEFVIRKIKLCT